MKRQEPTLGTPAELADLQFGRRPHRPAPPQKTGMDLSWKIAIGVFTGLSLFGLATCAGLAVIGTAVQQDQERQAQAVADELRRKLADPDPLGWRAAARENARREAAYYALAPGERCIGGKRFKRVDGGWVQQSRPCR